jgi:SAM-dependent methyltransferase
MATTENYQQYTEYLQTRSRLGDIYRRYILFPRICKALQGAALDIGCGIGDLLAYRPNTTGIDVNPYNVEFCRKRGLIAEPIANGRYPFSENTFDSAVANHVIEHLIDPSPLLFEARRVLKPGGIFLIGVPGRRGFSSDPDHKTFYDLEKLNGVAGNHGFKVTGHFYLPLPLPWLSRAIKQFSLNLVATKN